LGFKWINKNIPKIGARDLARGCKAFSDDIRNRDALVLKVLRSNRPHAKILDVAVAVALKRPGVVGILTCKDVPGKNRHGLINKDQPLLSEDRVRFVGEPVALVAAEDEKAAQTAIEAIRVTYEDLPPVFDPEKALEDGAPTIHHKGNLLFRRTLQKGDVTQEFARCHVVLKRSYSTPHLEHSYLEPDAGLGYVDQDGTLVIYASTQNPHYDQKEVCEILGLEDDEVRVVQAATGGGFGSKLDLTVQGFIGLALYHFRRPVRLVFSREEAFLATTKRHPLKIEIETGAMRDGRVVAVRARVVCDTGAYASYGVAVVTRAAVHVTGPYQVDNVEVESLGVYTNNPVAGAMRGFGTPQMAFASESQMDILAHELGMDPLEIRKINALRPGGTTATGQKLSESVGFLKTLNAIEPHYRKARLQWKGNEPPGCYKKGIGLGAMMYGIGNTGVQNPSSSRVEIDEKGKMTLFTGAADIGQGASTILAQIVAEVLDVDPHKIRVVAADTGWTTSAGATSASRQTYISGNAVKEAAQKVLDVLLCEGVDVLKAPRTDLVLKDGYVMGSGDSFGKVSLKELAKRAHRKGRSLSRQGYFDPETTLLDLDTGQGDPYATYAFGCQLALVEVDELTGNVCVSEIVAAHDVGRAINPQNVEGQIEGGVAMGLGFALMEKYIPGATHTMGEYHIPTCLDMPRVTTIIIEDPEPTGPFGAKGVGEPALIPTAPAILNAITDALGERIYDLPADPERVRETGIRSLKSKN